jgi:hypothetical protein
MKPIWYIDFTIPSKSETGMTTAARCAILFQIVHGIMRQFPGQYAVAFPSSRHFFSVIRVFAGSGEELDALKREIETNQDIRSIYVSGTPNLTPETFSGYSEFRRYRIPTRKADRHDGAPCRQRRLIEAQERSIPYLKIYSKSTGRNFSLHVERFDYETLPQQADDLSPDSYGLSRTTCRVFVPNFAA